ncbi:hypothetical protein [uncultured Roseobacter sp.]|uniref:hypothetical protein n=1 Tax=uncultured Roseobacter sp. TaxID=114847 RepID=UPI00262B52D9|nr:hypothetical protein [uncultured Roseobacter sp.]
MRALFPIKKVLKQASEVIYFVGGEGNWKLFPHEEAILMSAFKVLPPEARELLHQQISRDFFVERTNKRINVLRFYDAHSDLRINDPDFEDKWLRVHMRVNGKKEISNVNIYRDFIFSIETWSPKKMYTDAQIRIEKVDQEEADKSYTKSIDRLEHGRD